MSHYLAVLMVMAGVLVATQAAFRCCVPLQWEGVISQTVGVYKGARKGNFSSNTILFTYDALNKRRAMRYNSRNTLENKIIQDFRAKRQYTIEGSKCTYSNFTVAFERECVPANATYRGRNYIGTGTSKMMIDMWRWRARQRDVFYSFSADGLCVPISRLAYGVFIVEFPFIGDEIITSEFTNVNRGIKDPKVFAPPPGCRPARSKDTLYFENRYPGTSKLSM